jgi:hypothetical protein
MFEFKDKRYRPDFYTKNVGFDEQVIVQYPELNDFKNSELNKYTKNRYAITRHEVSDYRVISHIQESEFTKIYFSKANIQIIQNELRYRVYLASNARHIIEEQDLTYLGPIMEKIYLDYSFNPNERCKYKTEITRLNELVLNYCVPMVLSAVEMQLGYIKKISTDVIPIRHSEFASKKGTKITKMINPAF